MCGNGWLLVRKSGQSGPVFKTQREEGLGHLCHVDSNVAHCTVKSRKCLGATEIGGDGDKLERGKSLEVDHQRYEMK